ncbi:MAG TPA: inositol-3-phosphate synthase [Planctomycetota bacterium]|nr:inositol-3-phosphate synthase [Planctomycetota bacterium]
MPQKTKSSAQRRIGVWLIGGRGSVSTCVVYGLAGLREGWLDPTGLITAAAPLSALPLAGFDELVLGGHDVCRRPMTESAGELVKSNILSQDLVTLAAPHATAYEARLRAGLLDDADVGFANLDPLTARLGGLSPREKIAHVAEDLAAFARAEQLERVVVVHLASTEAFRPPHDSWRTLEAFEKSLDAGASQPASCLYAYAALANGHPYVNFTPSPGSSIPALRELAMQRRVPHCGSDGKTGETLLKTVLAPMFVARALKVRAWQGYNMLGNRDGEVLADPMHKEAKLRNKNDALRAILGDPEVHTHVGIDYVPSLDDWKTAFDLVHFEGFLGARMTLSFTWTGSDSALAAPLVIDLARLTEYSARRGEVGELPHTASFFKSPIAGGTHDFHAQFERLVGYALAEAKRS